MALGVDFLLTQRVSVHESLLYYPFIRKDNHSDLPEGNN